MKAKNLNTLISATIFAGLVGNAIMDYSGWPLVGTLFGHALLVGILWAVVNNFINERSEA